MELPQDQVAILNVRIDSLYEIVERLTAQTTEVLTELRSPKKNEDSHPQLSGAVGRFSQASRSQFNASMEHKDVLVDSDYPDPDSQQGERVLSPEVQIQRLTAQLTAAYNRIAALEEQLLARRIQVH